jgi:hypothetical protein
MTMNRFYYMPWKTVTSAIAKMVCHARMNGLIHDNWLRACQSCLLGLMYALRVNVCS